ncbi:MAG: hypothetical protein SOZ81_01595 [Agathobacter sp.]|nr:hypothetical protein [Agathobacter sp.]
MLDWFDIDNGDIGCSNDDFDSDFSSDTDDAFSSETDDTFDSDLCTTTFVSDYDSSELSFRGNDEQYYMKKAENATDQQNWNLERAKVALKNGQETVYKDHMTNAEIWAKRAKEFLTKAKIASKNN